VKCIIFLQLLLCVTGLAYVVCYIYRFILVWDTVEFLRNTFYEQFVSMAFLAAWDEVRNLQFILCMAMVPTTKPVNQWE
jgi:hypothetical protein